MKYNKSEIMKNAWTIRRKENANMSSALKKAWAQAKRKEENDMVKTEIKALIDKYQLVMHNGKLGTFAQVNKADFMRDVPSHKEEIIAYIEAEEKAKQEKRDRDQANFDAIPGVREIAEARSQYAAWKAAFNRMMETGSSKMPAIKAMSPAEIAALEAKYPMAVFALEARYRASATENDQLYTIWSATYQAIRNGKAIADIKADHDRRMSAYTKSVMFD